MLYPAELRALLLFICFRRKHISYCFLIANINMQIPLVKRQINDKHNYKQKAPKLYYTTHPLNHETSLEESYTVRIVIMALEVAVWRAVAT